MNCFRMYLCVVTVLHKEPWESVFDVATVCEKMCVRVCVYACVCVCVACMHASMCMVFACISMGGCNLYVSGFS